MNATTSTPTTIVADDRVRVADGFAEVGDVRALASTQRVDVLASRLFDSRDAIALAAEVVGALRWLAQSCDDGPELPAAVTVDGTAGVAGDRDGVTVWESGIQVDRSRSRYSGVSAPEATITAPRGGFTPSEAMRFVSALMGAGAFLDAETDAYTTRLLSEWD
ncbi:hypothetical protein [Gordonia otitidis]|uniref:Uncharacterized protein n=1 Tax=Gordonia otitidis (strain DSM 44809 / CCUG 52243 / JCM 12355 / NBRC 100426 / IFM 10032) TaxID=1108044 RepID=H5TSM1_GORO1|nr:hypothetical protein [Gordonia otitidis]GAB36479.1 hypothetical protein GOOTI_221_00220 [Gordonia otitidis NBRC 100426]